MRENHMELDALYNMDCIKGMGQIKAGSVDLAFADPPFNIGYKYDVYEDRLAADRYLDWTHKWGAALVKTLKPTGTFWLAIGALLLRPVDERRREGDAPLPKPVPEALISPEPAG